MTTVRAAAPIVIVGVVVSAAIMLVAGLFLLDVSKLVGADQDWAKPEGIFAMGFFAFMVGLLSTVACAILVRWLPIGLIAFGVTAIGLGVYATFMALDQKPDLAPLFIVLHVVFVASFGLALPYRLFVASGRAGGTRRFATR
jgi:hypothetical protein